METPKGQTAFNADAANLSGKRTFAPEPLATHNAVAAWLRRPGESHQIHESQGTLSSPFLSCHSREKNESPVTQRLTARISPFEALPPEIPGVREHPSYSEAEVDLCDRYLLPYAPQGR